MKSVLYSGWLTKSPPERKTQGPWKIFKSQWRRRFFVLSNMHASNVLPGSCPVQLEYFDSEKQTKRKGSINLNNCEQIDTDIESACYRHIFVVKTTDRGQQRSYYLAADSEKDMEQWVNQLRSHLSLQDEGSVVFAPRLNHSQSTTMPSRNVPINGRRLASTPVSSADSSGLLSPVSEILDPFDSPPSQFGNQQLSYDYFPLNQCSTGVTPLPAPRANPPVRVVTVNVRNQASLSSPQSGLSEEDKNAAGDEACDRGSEIYKVPPPTDSEIYNVPSSGRIIQDTTYDYPKPTVRERNRDSNYDYPPPLNSLTSEGDRDLTYDYPPGAPRRSRDGDGEQPLWECESKQVSEVIGDTYDLLPSCVHNQSDEVDSMGCHQPLHNNITGDPHSSSEVYDIPPQFSKTSNPLPPPKAHPMPPKFHRYINAAPTPVANRLTPPSPPRASTDDGLYLEMNSFESEDNTYVPMMQANNFDSQPRRLKSAVHLSAQRPVEKPSKVPLTLPRTFATVTNHLDYPKDFCHATHRTRSFQRHIPSPDSENIILPQKIGTDSSSSSEDEDDDDSEETNSVQNSASSENESPIQQEKPVIQYLDLDLNTSPDQPSFGSSVSDPQNKIEYNEIDVERTTALFNAKLMLEKERKGSDKSES